MSSIVHKLADEIALHGSYEAYIAWQDSQSRVGQVPGMHNPPPPPTGRLIREGQEGARPANWNPSPELPPREEYKLTSVHYLKTLPGPFQWVQSGLKTAEMRFNDRNFRIGDRLVLQEWEPNNEQYTGRKVVRQVTSILEGGSWGIEPGYVMLSMSTLPSNSQKRLLMIKAISYTASILIPFIFLNLVIKGVETHIYDYVPNRGLSVIQMACTMLLSIIIAEIGLKAAKENENSTP
ncbi:DUF3850 domain-containing protein [Dyadobacter crusticola]|uniref:DUF3850 domain-containing protein n=1 Tax=Dyadobacter crusticola TaxID=292407 RepID=UPI000B112EBC